MSKTKQITPKWEIKDRTYFLKNEVSPLTYTLGTRHSRRYPLLHFDETSGDSDFSKIGIATEGNLTIQAGENIRTFILVHNGAMTIKLPELKFTVTASNGKEISKNKQANCKTKTSSMIKQQQTHVSISNT